MAELHIYSPLRSPRLDFIVRHIFDRMLGWESRLTHDFESIPEGVPLLVYDELGLEESFHIRPAGLLENAAVADSMEELNFDGHLVAFPAPASIPFDLFSFAFHLVSRMEEYEPISKDEHGRFRSKDCWVVRSGQEKIPILDQLVLSISRLLRQRWPRLPEPKRAFTNVVTFDMDNGLKYAGREPWRSAGSAIRDLMQLKLRALRERSGVLFQGKKDPYELGDYLKELSENADRLITFFIASERSTNDHAIPLTAPRMAQKVRKTGEWSEIGLHPSYRTMEEPSRISKEQDALSELVGEPIVTSRQHFLRFRMPDTIRELALLGIGEEHSMGFNDRIGFRAGTCTPFPFYDLEREKETNLMLHPFAMMDSALAYHMRVSVQDAIDLTRALRKEVEEVSGHFETVWHERFLAGTGSEKGWERFFTEIMQS